LADTSVKAMQVLDCYLVVEVPPDEVLFIDQHPLHVRILFEQMQERVRAGQLGRQRHPAAGRGDRAAHPAAPRWDGQLWQLWWQGFLIKAFHRPAVNQEIVLATLEEKGWPKRIDYPLPPVAGIDPKGRRQPIGSGEHHVERP
jgi:hypothetical protein